MDRSVRVGDRIKSKRFGLLVGRIYFRGNGSYYLDFRTCEPATDSIRPVTIEERRKGGWSRRLTEEVDARLPGDFSDTVFRVVAIETAQYDEDSILYSEDWSVRVRMGVFGHCNDVKKEDIELVSEEPDPAEIPPKRSSRRKAGRQ